jgi:predicted nucleic acid-binding protein
MSVEFVDTNVIVYAHDKSAGVKQQRAADLLHRLAEGSSAGISVQVMVEFYATAVRKLALSAGQAEAIVKYFEEWPQFHAAGYEDVLRAIQLQRRYQISIRDAMILNSAIQLGCGILWTEDLTHGQRYESVTVRNPFV